MTQRCRVTETGDPQKTGQDLTPLLSDEELGQLQLTTLQYYLRESNPTNGLIRDKMEPGAPSSIAAIGLALAIVPVLVERGVISHEFAPELVLKRLRFFRDSPHGPHPDAMGYRGFYYYFLDMKIGRRVWECERSTIDSAFLFAGQEPYTGRPPQLRIAPAQARVKSGDIVLVPYQMVDTSSSRVQGSVVRPARHHVTCCDPV